MSSALPPSSVALPPITRSSPFSILPTELIQTIIESTVPLHYHSDSYTARQSTLHSLCLVSKLFHQIAKPLLFAVVLTTHQSTMDLWKKCTREDGEFAREIFAGAARSQSSNPILNNVKAVVRLGRNLRTISLNSCVPGYLDISQFSAAPREQLSLDCEK